MEPSIARRLIPDTGENMQKFLDGCSDEELVVILRYIQAQLKDELVRRSRMQDPTNSVQTIDFDGMVNAIPYNSFQG